MLTAVAIFLVAGTSVAPVVEAQPVVAAQHRASNAAPTAYSEVVRRVRLPHQTPHNPYLTPCERVVELMCDAGGPSVCVYIKRHLVRRAFTESDQRECRQLLDDPDKFNRSLDQLRRWAGRQKP